MKLKWKLNEQQIDADAINNWMNVFIQLIELLVAFNCWNEKLIEKTFLTYSAAKDSNEIVFIYENNECMAHGGQYKNEWKRFSGMPQRHWLLN